jgi:hypothetical protein
VYRHDRYLKPTIQSIINSLHGRLTLYHINYKTLKYSVFSSQFTCSRSYASKHRNSFVGFEVLTAAIIALMMEAARTSETLVNFYQTTRRYNPEDIHLRNIFVFNSEFILKQDIVLT